jgi:hypothetical protein
LWIINEGSIYIEFNCNHNHERITSTTKEQSTKEPMNSPLCKHKDIFGVPKEGIHKPRFLGMAFWDLFFTLVGACLIVWGFKRKFNVMNVSIAFVGLFLLGQFLHWLFCVKTAFLRMIFGK